MVIAVVGWNHYQERQLGQIVLTTDDPTKTLVAEVFASESDDLVLPAFTVPTQQPVALREGEYRVRLSSTAPGVLSETYLMTVERGVKQQFDVRLDARGFPEPVEVKQDERNALLEIDKRTDVIVLGEKSIRRVKAATREVVWQKSLTAEEQPVVDEAQKKARISLSFAPERTAPLWLIEPAPDLNGDGVPCVVWVGRSGQSLTAVSARDGKVQWCFTGNNITHPLAVDRTGDGKKDVLAVVDGGIEAIDGRSGATVWRYAVPALEGRSEPRSDYVAVSRRTGGRHLVDIVYAGHVHTLDAQTGQRVGAIHELGFKPKKPPLAADLDGDGQPDAFLFERKREELVTLQAFDLGSRRMLWQAQLGKDTSPQEPILADLDGDGKPEVIVLASNVSGINHQEFHPRALEIRVLDGLTGQPRWQRRLKTTGRGGNQGKERLIVGPDLNGDGQRDVFVATDFTSRDEEWGDRNNQEHWLYVDALSGRDGSPLWRSRHSLGRDRTIEDAQFAPLRWWQPGPDGWPLLVVPIREDARSLDRDRWHTFILASGSGRLVHDMTGAGEPMVADLDGDGLLDLVRFVPQTQSRTAGAIHTVRGSPPTVWQRLRERSEEQHAVADLDGDGFADIAQGGSQHTRPGLRTWSGRDGKRLWSQSDILRGQMVVSARLPLGPGNGVPALLAPSDHDLRALAARDGKQLWKIDLKILYYGGSVAWLDSHDLTAGGEPSVLVGYNIADDSSGQRTELIELVRINGRTGTKDWTRTVEGHSDSSHCLRPALADLNGDGVLDMVFWPPVSAHGQSSPRLHAINGKDGTVLWQGPTPPRDWENARGSQSLPPFVPAVIRLAGAGGHVVVVPDTDAAGREGVVALNGANGDRKWTWSGSRPNVQGSRWKICDPVAVRIGSGRMGCAFVEYGDSEPWQLVILDGQGGVVGQADRDAPPFSPCLPDVRAFDLEGNGRDELLVFNGKMLRVFDGEAKEELWKWEASAKRSVLVAIQPSGPSHPAMVLMHDGDHLLGLDGKTGNVRWRGLAEWPDNNRIAQSILATNHAQGFPWLLGVNSGVMLVRPVVPVGEEGRYEPATPAAMPYNPLPPDPRLARPLPWAAFQREPWLAGPALALLLGGLTLLLIRGRWRWAVALFLMCLLAPLAYGLVHLWIDSRGMAVEEHYARGGWHVVWLELIRVVAGWAAVPALVLALSTFAASLLLRGRDRLRRRR